MLQSLGRSQRHSESAFERWVLSASRQTHDKQAAALNVQMAQQRRAIVHSAHNSLQAEKESLRSIADVAEDWKRRHSSLAQALSDTAVQLPISAVICDDRQVVAALRRSQQLLARFSHVFGSSAKQVRYCTALALCTKSFDAPLQVEAMSESTLALSEVVQKQVERLQETSSLLLAASEAESKLRSLLIQQCDSC